MQPPIPVPIKTLEFPAESAVGQSSPGQSSAGQTPQQRSPSKPRTPRRRWQLSLRDAMFLLLLVAVLAGWWRDRQNLVGQINDIMNQINGGSSWSFEQVLGPPDTSGYGDIPSAWASLTPDGQREWLLLEFPQAVVPQAIEVYETYNPGAIDQVSVWDSAGKEVVAWSGTDPLPRSARKGASIIPINIRFKTRKIKIQLDSVNVPGWNEIDAVGLRGRDGTIQWASAGKASSSFGSARRMLLSATGARLVFPQGSVGGPILSPPTQEMLGVPLHGDPQVPSAPDSGKVGQ